MGFLKKYLKKKGVVQTGDIDPQPTRYKCPFYGFNGMFRVFLDSSGNQCALVVDSYSPCGMEMEKQTPDWTKCPRNDGTDMARLDTLGIKIFPLEFRPQDQDSWQGLSFGKWYEYVMSDKCPRPQHTRELCRLDLRSSLSFYSHQLIKYY